MASSVAGCSSVEDVVTRLEAAATTASVNLLRVFGRMQCIQHNAACLESDGGRFGNLFALLLDKVIACAIFQFFEEVIALWGTCALSPFHSVKQDESRVVSRFLLFRDHLSSVALSVSLLPFRGRVFRLVRNLSRTNCERRREHELCVCPACRCVWLKIFLFCGFRCILGFSTLTEFTY
jgi:hypothetical protein